MDAVKLDWREDGALAGCTAAVIGMARSGRAVVAALQARGAKVLAYDRDQIARDDEIAGMLSAGMTLSCGAGFPGVDQADFIVPSPGMPADEDVLRDAVSRGVPVLSEIEVAYRISLAPLLAFTGSNGKSTTTALCGHMLRTAGLDARIGGNLAPGTPLTRLADVSSRKQVLVAEISSFQLEWIHAFRPRVGAVLNVTEEHLQRHKTMRAYAAAKARIVENQAGADLAIFGDSFAEEFPDLLSGDGRHYRFCRTHPVESGAYMDGDTMRIVGRVDPVEGSLPDLKIDVSRFRLEGGHNRENAMAAAMAALEMGVRPEAIEKALRTFKGLPHRMELVAEVGGVRYINNSMCTNAAAAVASLEGVCGEAVVITGGSSKGLNMRPFGEALARVAQWSVLIGQTADEMEGYLLETECRRYERATDMDDAVDRASRRAVAGQAVILIPGFASFDMFHDFEDRGNAFADAVRKLESGAAMPAGKER